MTCPTAATFTLDKIEITDRETLLEIGRGLTAVNRAISMHPKLAQAAAIIAYEKQKDCPGKAWLQAKPFHPAIYRALKVDRDDPAAAYACLPFRLGLMNGEHRILAAIDCPKVSDDPLPADIETVVAWDPRTNAHSIVGDGQDRLIVCSNSDDLFADFFAFARQWIESRAIYFERRRMQKDNRWVHPLPETTGAAGMLLCGDVKAVRWPELPETIRCVGIDPKAVNSAIFRAARLPRAWTNDERAVA